MRLWFAGTLFVSAALLFCVEPMIAKMILPFWGGAPAVWTACMLFFQAALLAGYAYAHAVMGLEPRARVLVHVAVLLVPLAVLPFDVAHRAATLAPGLHPTLRLLVLLTIAIGLPFFAASTSGPMLQAWFARTASTSARDPYPLYAASNLGSLLALAAYPLVIERGWGLARQARGWAWAYGIVVAMTLVCAGASLRGAARAGSALPAFSPRLAGSAADEPDASPIRWRRRAIWIALAFVPSSQMLGVTTYITTALAPIPLLWVLPLGLYLASFVLVFAKRPPIPQAVVVRLLPLGVAVSTLLLAGEASGPLWLVLPVHLVTLLLGAMVCHGELARDRPAPRRLTDFYLWLAVGGVLGGVFNGIVAPVLFPGIVEYPLALVLACMCRRPDPKPEIASSWRRDVAFGLAAFALTSILVLGWRTLGREADRLGIAVMFCTPVVLFYRFLDRPLRFALAIGGVHLGSVFSTGVHGVTLERERSFFGVLRVTRDASGYHRLVHGSTMHGRQSLDPARRHEPLAYYARTGPVGEVFQLLAARSTEARVAVVGLGVGSLAAYARPAERWTFYEIDPGVVRIAFDPRFFTFLSDAFPDRSNLDVLVGDARLELESASEGGYSLLVLDAFTSDAIPTHLLTREAVQLYLRKLAPGGLLAFHVSNGFVDLGPVLGALARDADLAGRARYEETVSPAEAAGGKTPSQWAVLTRERPLLEPLVALGWQPLPVRSDLRTWTDDDSNIAQILK